MRPLRIPISLSHRRLASTNSPLPTRSRLTTLPRRLLFWAPYLLLGALGGHVGSWLTRRYVFCVTAGPSMLPLLSFQYGAVVFNPFYRVGRGGGGGGENRRGPVEVGDVISYRSPMEVDERLVKRVVGLPGDYVVVGKRRRQQGEVQYVKNLIDIRHQQQEELEEDHVVMAVVPQGHVWVEGDNSSGSMDSRHYGPVPMALIESRVAFFVNWDEWLPRIEVPGGLRKSEEYSL